jgi:hypothetical protein
MNTTNETSVGSVACGESAGNPQAKWACRAIGFLSLALGAALVGIGWLLAENPGIFNARNPRYEPPHACACLECRHGYVNGPNGELYCAKYPPKAFLDARMSASAKQTRLTLGAAFGIVGLCLAVLTLACGFLWLAGLWIPKGPARWHTVACRAAPLLAVGC